MNKAIHRLVVLSCVLLGSWPNLSQAATLAEITPRFLPKEHYPRELQGRDLEELEEFSASATSSSEISSWRDLGGRWVAALDRKGAALAIYDVSFPTALGPVSLARVGGSKFTLERLLELLQAYDAPTKAQAKLAGLEEKQLSGALLRDGWWREVPWKTESALLASQDEAPKAFRLSDIDFARLIKRPKLFLQSLEYLRSKFGIELASFRYERQDDGSYQLLWRDGQMSLFAGIDAAKIADIKSPASGLVDALASKFAAQVASFAAGQIPVPVVSALVGTALERLLLFRSELIILHQQQAREMLVQARENPTKGGLAFSSLSEEEQLRAGQSIVMAESGLFSSWQWLFKNSRKAWLESTKQELKAASLSREWLARNGTEVELQNDRYAAARAAFPGSEIGSLYLLAFQGPGLSPKIAFNSTDPGKIFFERLLIETASTLVSFATRFIPLPFVGGVVSGAFDTVVRDPMVEAKKWDSRLIAHIEQGAAWHEALPVLDRQRVNPLELPRKQLTSLIEHRKKRLGL